MQIDETGARLQAPGCGPDPRATVAPGQSRVTLALAGPVAPSVSKRSDRTTGADSSVRSPEAGDAKASAGWDWLRGTSLHDPPKVQPNDPFPSFPRKQRPAGDGPDRVVEFMHLGVCNPVAVGCHGLYIP